MKRLVIVMAALLFVPMASAVEGPICSEPSGLEIGPEPFDLEGGSGSLGLEMSPEVRVILNPPAMACIWIKCFSHSTCQFYNCGLCDYEEGLPEGYCGLF